MTGDTADGGVPTEDQATETAPTGGAGVDDRHRDAALPAVVTGRW